MRSRGVCVTALLIACGGPSGSGGGGGGETLAPTTAPPWTTTGTTTVPTDTAPPLSDEVPNAYVTASHHGYWDMAPGGGPYLTMSGTLVLQEWPGSLVAPPDDTADTGTDDGPVFRPECWVRYALDGGPSEDHPPCEMCVAAFEVRFVEVEGQTKACLQIDLPDPKQTRHLGWDGEGTVWWDYAHTGVWVPLWAGTAMGDRVSFSWSERFAIDAPDDTGSSE